MDELSNILKKQNRFPVQKILVRTSNAEQKRLDRVERLLNMKGRMICTVKSPPDVVVLLDDLMTTGATLESCAAALKEAGTRMVYGLTLFHD